MLRTRLNDLERRARTVASTPRPTIESDLQMAVAWLETGEGPPARPLTDAQKADPKLMGELECLRFELEMSPAEVEAAANPPAAPAAAEAAPA
jgi:hypothetical protein